MLWSLKSLSQQWQVRARYSSGVHLVPLAAIRGSEGKEDAFDHAFHPLHREHSRERWLGIAMAQWQGQNLPPVELIKVDDGRSAVYFVRDGHHRISVARAFGQREIEADVTVWQLNGPAPWNACEPSTQTAVHAAHNQRQGESQPSVVFGRVLITLIQNAISNASQTFA